MLNCASPRELLMAKRAKKPKIDPEPPEFPLKKIVSGGQTGVDRAALDAAILLGVPHGGWCPRGRLAEDGSIPIHYNLQETESRRYYVRTELNVKDSDGTLILFRRAITRGTALTKRCAEHYRKPLLCIDLSRPSDNRRETVRDWIVKHQIATLNIAGPRESSASGIAAEVRSFLIDVLKRPRPVRHRGERPAIACYRAIDLDPTCEHP